MQYIITMSNLLCEHNNFVLVFSLGNFWPDFFNKAYSATLRIHMEQIIPIY